VVTLAGVTSKPCCIISVYIQSWLVVSHGIMWWAACWFWWSCLFVVEPTAKRFSCRRKNVDNKPWHSMLTSVLDDNPFDKTAANDSASPFPHSSRIISDERRGVGGLSQQQHQWHVVCSGIDVNVEQRRRSTTCVCLSVSLYHLLVCVSGERKVHESAAVGPLAHKTLAKGPDPSLAQGPNKKLLL